MGFVQFEPVRNSPQAYQSGGTRKACAVIRDTDWKTRLTAGLLALHNVYNVPNVRFCGACSGRPRNSPTSRTMERLRSHSLPWRARKTPPLRLNAPRPNATACAYDKPHLARGKRSLVCLPDSYACTGPTLSIRGRCLQAAPDIFFVLTYTLLFVGHHQLGDVSLFRSIRKRQRVHEVRDGIAGFKED